MLPGTTDTRPAHHSGPGPRLTVPADVAAPSVMRQRVRAWLGELRWPRARTDDLILGLSEAVTNVITHAYPPPRALGRVHLSTEHRISGDGTRRVIMVIGDRGRWQPNAKSVPGARGGGLARIRTLSESLIIDTAGAGTILTITSYPLCGVASR
ncbi:MAG TPA: ATP-binding protein [Pseudonocardia sp.]